MNRIFQDNLAKEAKGLYDIGLCILPADGKKPALPAWKSFQNKRPSIKNLLSWIYKIKELTGICVVLGKVSNDWVARDFDKNSSFRLWSQQYPDFYKNLPLVKTFRGKHVYFRTTQPFGMKKYSDGELRGEKCILLAPPSLHPSGGAYEWLRRLNTVQNNPLDPEETGLARDWFEGQEDAIEVVEGVEGVEEVLSVKPEEVKAVEDVVMRVLPPTFNQNHASLFSLARHILGLKITLGWDTNKYTQMADFAFEIWNQKNNYLDPNQSKLDYQYEWEETLAGVRFPPDVNVVSLAWDQSLKSTKLPAIEKLPRPELKQAAYLCLELQKINQSSAFFISTYSLGKLLHVNPKTAWLILNRLKKDNFIKLAKQGNRVSANRYRWVGGLVSLDFMASARKEVTTL